MTLSAQPRLQTSFRSLLKPLIAASFLELVLWRLVSNLSPPESAGAVYQIHSILRSLGPLTLNLAHVFAALVSVLGALWLIQIRERLAIMAAVLLLALAQLSFLLSFIGFEQGIWLVYQVTFLGIVVALALRLALSHGTIAKVLGAILAGVYISSFYFKATPLIDSSLSLSGHGFGSEVFAAGENLVVVSSLIFLMFTTKILREKRESVKWALLSFAPAAIFSLAYLTSPWLTTAISILALGFDLHLPFPAYAASLWIFTFVLIKLAARKSDASYGLFLLFLAGIMLQHPYLNLLVILGLVLLGSPTMIKDTPLYSK